MKLKIMLLLLLFCSGRCGRSESDFVDDHGVSDDVVVEESWADAEISTSSVCGYPTHSGYATYHGEIECERSQFLEDRNRPYSELHRAVELEMRPLAEAESGLTERRSTLNPIFCGDLTHYRLPQVSNVRWFEQTQLLAETEPVSPLLDHLPTTSTYFRMERPQRLSSCFLFYESRKDSVEKAEFNYRYNSDMYFCLTQSSRVRSDWRIIQLRAIRLDPFAPVYSLAIRQVDFDPNEELLSTSEASSICAFERRAIRHLERNVDCEVVVDQQKDEIQIVGAVRNQGDLYRRSIFIRGRPPNERTLIAVFSYCLKRFE